MIFFQAKSDAFAALEEAMQRPDIAASMASHLDRLVTVFLESISAFQPGNFKLSIETDFSHVHALPRDGEPPCTLQI